MNLSINEKELKFICSIMQEHTKMPILLGIDGVIKKIYSPFSREHPLVNQQDLYLQLLKIPEVILDIPIIKTTNGLEYYLCMYSKNQEGQMLSFLIGPCLMGKLRDKILYQFIEMHKVPRYLKDPLQTYLVSLPIYTVFDLARIGQLFYFLLFRKGIDTSEIIQEDGTSKPFLSFDLDMDLMLAKKRAEENLHHDNLKEKKLYHLVKEGLTEKVKEFFSSPVIFEGVGTVTKNNPVRNDKNLAITIVALASRAAMDGGLHSEIAYTISDMFIQRIEDDPEFNNLVSLSKEIYLEYAKRVKELKEQNYSKSIVSVQQYIYNHLYKKIELDSLADHVHLHPSYLSRLFKKQVGLTISDYILREKVKEAKTWLDKSDLSITEIANQLNFHDQSHFIKAYKRIEGITPKQYRLQQ
ncbi:AraC family transcriptional regulator [Niallia sp. JL1B1071]|uniref:AraC family transcriptional regulator n=1 Tax=Niallia tiangongensis TaxID=3237105 RepID=UPI0037DC74F8